MFKEKPITRQAPPTPLTVSEDRSKITDRCIVGTPDDSDPFMPNARRISKSSRDNSAPFTRSGSSLSRSLSKPWSRGVGATPSPGSINWFSDSMSRGSSPPPLPLPENATMAASIPEIDSLGIIGEINESVDFASYRPGSKPIIIAPVIAVQSPNARVSPFQHPELSGSPQSASPTNSPEYPPSEGNAVNLIATSTSLQATINSSNVMLGMGILTLPYAIHISGWIFGLLLLWLLALMAQFTAKLLAKCMQVPFPEQEDLCETTPLLSHNPHRHRAAATSRQSAVVARLPSSLSDVVELAFGSRFRPFVSFMFMFELFAAATGLVLLGADSVVALLPALDILTVKIVITLFFILTTFPRGMGWLAYGSVIGVLALLSLFGILIFNGLMTYTAPGSLWEPADTNLWPEQVSPFAKERSMWLAVGLFSIGLDAHAVFPSIYRDLKTPKDFGKVVERAYTLNWALYAGFGTVGYLMFGKAIMPQVTQNFPLIPTFNKGLTTFILFLTALNSLTKYALIMAPINYQVEQIFGIPAHSPMTATHMFTSPSGMLIRVVLGICAILTTILFPTFHVLIGLVGSLFSFLIMGVIPCICYLKLGTGNGYRQDEVVEGCRITWMEFLICVLVVLGSLTLGTLGSIASFYSV